MPYIKREARLEIDLDNRIPATAGELNYAITRLVHEYMRTWGEDYQNYNDCIGALEGAKLELYRRRVAPYEDEKIKSNGDVG